MHASCVLINDITRNFGIALILAVNFQGVTLENLSKSDQILMTFEKAEVCFSVACLDLSSSTRCVFYDVGANGGCLLHLRILLMSMTSLAELYVSVVNFNSLVHKVVALPHQL